MAFARKRRYANKPNQRRDVSFQAYVSKSESEYLERAIAMISERDGHRYSKGEFLMWMFSELFGDREHTLSQLNDFEEDTSEIRKAMDILNAIIERREGFSRELRDYDEEDEE